MPDNVTFETDAFAATKEVWLKASDYLGLKKNNGTTQIKRLSPRLYNKVKIFRVKHTAFGKKYYIGRALDFITFIVSIFGVCLDTSFLEDFIVLFISCSI